MLLEDVEAAEDKAPNAYKARRGPLDGEDGDPFPQGLLAPQFASIRSIRAVQCLAR